MINEELAEEYTNNISEFELTLSSLSAEVIKG